MCDDPAHKIFNMYKEKNNKISGKNIRLILFSMGIDLGQIETLDNDTFYDFNNFKKILDTNILNSDILVDVCVLKMALQKKFSVTDVEHIIISTYGNVSDGQLVDPNLIIEWLKKIDIDT